MDTCTLPARWYGRRSVPHEGEQTLQTGPPEQELVYAVIREALEDLRLRRAFWGEAYWFFFAPDDESNFSSFSNHLKMDPQAGRDRIIRELDQTGPTSGPFKGQPMTHKDYQEMLLQTERQRAALARRVSNYSMAAEREARSREKRNAEIADLRATVAELREQLWALQNKADESAGKPAPEVPPGKPKRNYKAERAARKAQKEKEGKA